MSRWVFVALGLLIGCAGRAEPSSTDGGDRSAPGDRQITCFVDFPCMDWQAWSCTSDRGGRYNESKSCEYRCGSEPCSGGSCEPTGATFACASGTRCVERRPAWGDGGALTLDAPCQPIGAVDAGSSD